MLAEERRLLLVERSDKVVSDITQVHLGIYEGKTFEQVFARGAFGESMLLLNAMRLIQELMAGYNYYCDENRKLNQVLEYKKEMIEEARVLLALELPDYRICDTVELPAQKENA
jgi:hypothetical protein